MTKNFKRYQGEFRSLSDDGITLRQAAGEQTLKRTEVLRVFAKGKSHRARNAVSGAFIGAGAGLMIGLGPYYVHRNCTEGPAFACGYPPNPHLVEGLIPVGALAGAVIGAAMPTGRWHTVYRGR